ncbi:MAG: helix-turn-helix domain-containing protein [Acidimicrobiia bacterium]|nr:helix-turn-helix domain-containing protein [Acidimicrobiia bacterium]
MTASFGQLIKEQRIDMGLTQQRLADLVGRSPSTVRSWERDRATPNDETVIDSLSAVLGLDKKTLSDLAGVEFEGSWSEPDPASALIEDPSRNGLLEDRASVNGALDTPDAGYVAEAVENRSESSREARPQMVIGPEPAPRANGDEARTPGTARAPEPAKPYLLQTDRRADHGRAGPLRPGVDSVSEPSLFSDEPPAPAEPPSDWDAEIDLDDLPDPGPAPELPDAAPADAVPEPADVNPPAPGVAREGFGSESDVEVEDGWENEPTQILIPTTPTEERLLGVATAKAVEYLAEPRPRPVPDREPEAAGVTEVIERTPMVEIAPTVGAAAQATEPVRTVSQPGGAAQPRTQTMESGRPIGPNSYLDDPNEIRGYRIRAGLTAAALIAILIVARWAWAGFREQLGGILDTLTTGF